MATLRDIKKPPAEVFNRQRVFRYLASTLAKRKHYQQSLPYFKLGEDFARGPSQECPILTERANVYMSMGEMELARKDADRALQVCPNSLDTKITNIRLLFAEDEIEKCLIASHLGYKQRKILGQNIGSAVGTIERTIGRNAGNIMAMDNLGNTIVRIKKHNLGLIKKKQLTQYEKNEQDKKFENKLKCYNEIFMKENAPDKMFFLDCLNDKSVFPSSNLGSEIMIRDIMKSAVDRIHNKQMSLWIRKPLYTQERNNNKLSKLQIQEDKETKSIKIAVINNEALRQLKCIVKQLQTSDLVETYRKAMQLLKYLTSKQEFEVPNKNVFCDSLYEILGAMYLSTKVLKSNMTEAQNDARINYLLGIYKTYHVAIEVFKNDLHAEIFDFKKFINKMLESMKNATTPLEKAFLSHELSCAYSMRQKFEEARFYSRICCYESKKAENINWFFNGLFLLTRSELQEANITEAKTTLIAARDLANLFSFKDIHEFIIRSLEVISRETEASLRGGASIAKREKQLLDLMATPQLKSQMKNQLQYISNLPQKLKLPILPGVKTKKEQKQVQQHVSTEARMREEQNLQYKIRQRYTLQAPTMDLPKNY